MADYMVAACYILLTVSLLPSAQSQLPTCNVTADVLEEYNCAVNALVPQEQQGEMFHEPWSHYLKPLNDQLGAVHLFGNYIVNRLLLLEDDRCQAQYGLDLRDFIPKRVLKYTQEAHSCSEGYEDCAIPGPTVQHPTNVTYICLSEDSRPFGADKTCLDYCNEIPKYGVIRSNENGTEYSGGIFHMYILVVQASQHTNTHSFKLTIEFTRFNLESPAAGLDCGFNGDYLEIFDLATQQYTTLCGTDGEGLVITTTSTLYITFCSRLHSTSGQGFELVYTLQPYYTINPGFRNVELSSYMTSLQCNDTLLHHPLLTHAYFIDQHQRQDVYRPGNYYLHIYDYTMRNQQRGSVTLIENLGNPCSLSFQTEWYQYLEKVKQEFQGVLALRGTHANITEEVLEVMDAPSTAPPGSGIGVIGGLGSNDMTFVTGFPDAVNRLERVNMLVRNNYDDCSKGWNYYSHHCYYFLDTLLSFTEAQDGCRDLQASLVTWDHVAFSKIFTTRPFHLNGKRFWLGAYKDNADVWVYSIDDSPIHFPPPLADMFDNEDSSKRCIIADYNAPDREYYWLNEDCSAKYASVCIREVGHLVGVESEETNESVIEYNIELPSMYSALIKFTELNFTDNECADVSSCDCSSYVMVADNMTGTLEKICKTPETLPVVLTKSSKALITFYGLQANSALVNPVFSGCGGVVHSSYQGYISFSGTSSNINCIYTIGYSRHPSPNVLDSYAHGVHVELELLSLSTIENCTSAVDIYDGIDTSAPILWKGCSDSSKAKLISTSSVIVIVLHLGSSNSVHFLAKYKIGCDSERPPSEMEEVVVPGIPKWWSIPSLMCRVKLNLPRRPYVSFGAVCREFSDEHGNLIEGASLTCYGTNEDLSTHAPRQFVQSDDYLFNADTKYVDTVWYFHVGSESRSHVERRSQLSVTVRPKGVLYLVLFMRLNGTLKDFSKHNHKPTYNQGADLERMFSLNDPWQKDDQKALTFIDDFHLQIPLDATSPIPLQTNLTFVFWIYAPNCTEQHQTLFRFTSEQNVENYQLLSLDQCTLSITRMPQYVIKLDFLSNYDANNPYHISKWRKVAIGWREGDKELWTYVDGQFRRRARYTPEYFFHALTDYQFLAIGGTYEDLDPFNGSISCLQIYANSLSLTEIEEAHAKCAPKVAADFFLPLTDSLMELNSVQRFPKIKEEVSPPPPTLVPGPQANSSHWNKGMLFANGSIITYPDVNGYASVSSWSVMFWLNVQETADQTILALRLNDSDYFSIQMESGHLVIDGVVVEMSSLVPFTTHAWHLVAVTVDLFTEKYTVWIDEYKRTGGVTSPGAFPIAQNSLSVDLGPASGFALYCLQIFYWTLYQVDLVEAKKVCEEKPAIIRKEDCDPGWAWIHRATNKENYCVKNIGNAILDTEAVEMCDKLGASPLLFGDMETIFSSSYLVSPVWGGIWAGIAFTSNGTFESLHPNQNGVTWLWRSNLWLSPKWDKDYSESACELLSRNVDEMSLCSNSINVSTLTSGPLVTRNTPAYESSHTKVPHLLYPSTSVTSFDVICARRSEVGIELPLGACHKFTDTATLAGQYYSTGLYVPQFFMVKVTTEGGYMTCPSKPSLLLSTLDLCSSPTEGSFWLNPFWAEVISQPLPIEDSWRYQISYYKDTEWSQFDLVLQTYFTGYGTGHPRYENSKVRVVEDPTVSPVKYLFSKGYPQVSVGGEWRNYCEEDHRMVEWFCQQVTGFHCNSVSYGRIETMSQMNAVNSSGDLSSHCSPTEAMWVNCHKCYDGYSVLGAPANRIASPGYHRQAYQRNMLREFDISGQKMDDSSESMLVVEFEQIPSIDCERGDELYAVAIAYKNMSIANVTWNHCDNSSIPTNIARVPTYSMLIFRSSNQSEEGKGFAAEVYRVCLDDVEERMLTAFSATDFMLTIPSQGHYECTHTYLLADKTLFLVVKSLTNFTSASCCTITVGHGEVMEENVLLMVGNDLDQIYRNFTGYTKYWISYKQSVLQSCGQQEVVESSMRSIVLELQVVYYNVVRNRHSGQFFPPDFMFKSPGELIRDQIAIWLIKMYSQNHMYRLDFALAKFGVPCGDEKVGRSWIRLAYTNASSLIDIYAVGSLRSHNFTDYFVCDDDIDRNAHLSDTVHWYPDWPQVSCEGNLLVMLMVEPGMQLVRGFSAIFHQFDIEHSTACSQNAVERTESPTYYGEVVSSPYHPQEMPPHLHYEYIINSINGHSYRLEGVLVSQCRYVRMVASLPATGEIFDLCEEFKVEGDAMILSGSGSLIINMTSSERRPPVYRLVVNSLSNGPRVKVNFHKVLDEEECYSTDSIGYPTTFTRTVESQNFQKLVLSVTVPPCDKPCCHSFTYGSGDVIDRTTPHMICSNTTVAKVFYVQTLWAELSVDESLAIPDRLVAHACFTQLAFVEKTELSASLFTHPSNEHSETVYYISVPAPLRIRLEFLPDVSMCGGACCHKVLVGAGHPTSFLNGPLADNPVCWSDIPKVILSSTNEISLLVQSEPHVNAIDGAAIEYQTFIECSNVTLGESTSQLLYWDASIGSCEMVVTAPEFIRLQLMLDDVNLPDGQVRLVVHNYYTPQVYLNVRLQPNVPLVFTFPTDKIIVSFQPLSNSRRQKRQALPPISFSSTLVQFTSSTAACYTKLVLSRGTISSANYETGGLYEANTWCSWTLPDIIAPFTAYLLKFKSPFEVSRNPLGYCKDFISIMQEDGTPATTPLCGLTPPTDIYIASAATITFYSDSSVEMKGWSLMYYLTTLDVIRDVHGVITSPLYPAEYPANSAEEKGIVVPQGYRVHIYLADMDIQKCTPCFMCDYLSIQLTDVHDISKALCGQRPSVPPQLWSVEETASIIFGSNNQSEGRGFKLIYHAFKDCDVLLTDSLGFFTSPGYQHGGMEAGTDCFYVISAPQHHRVVLSYTAELAGDLCDGECCSYIMVRDGEYKLSPSTHGKQCGTVARRNFISAGEDMRVELSVAEGSDPPTDHGFNAMYLIYKSYFTELIGVIELPEALNLFSDLYLSNLFFEWYIEVDINYSLRLHIIGPVHLQPVKPFCKDKLEIYQRGYGEVSLSLSHDSSYFCANRTSFPPIYTSYNIMKIVFNSNPWNGMTGFGQLQYTALPKLFKDVSGVIESLSLSLPLEEDVYQEYFISLPIEYYIDMHFTDWDNVNCDSCSISVGEGTEVGVFTYFNYKNYCATIPAPIYSLTNNIWIRFIQKAQHLSPDWSIAHFKLNYQGELRVRTTPGHITSPGYPQLYPCHLARSWIIRAPQGHVVRLETEHLDMPDPDYLLIGDGLHPHEQIIAQYNNPGYSPVYSSLSDMWIFFYSHNDNQTADGFMLTYTFEQRELRYPAAVFNSPVDTSGYYVMDFIGWWNVTVKDGRKIEVNLTIDMPDTPGCLSASLTVTGLNSSLQKQCGMAVVKGLVTKENTFSVTLKTDSDSFIRNKHTGFKVSYQYIPLAGDSHFEDSMNGYMNVEPLRWEIGEGLSTVSGTGQKEESRFVHLRAGHIGDKYLIVKATGHYYGQKASIVSPVLTKGAKRLSFHYLMRGREVGTLRVLQAPCTGQGEVLVEPLPIWSRTGHQSDDWLQAVDIPASGNTTFYVLFFEAILGSGANVGNQPITEGDILIDDIYLDPVEYESCEGDTGFYCLNGGMCMALSKSYDLRGYGCLCYHGYYGAYCEQEVLDCQPDTCSGHGTCYETNTLSQTYWCSCDLGYTGQHCQHDINECADISNVLTQCSSHGTCKDEVNKFSCDCLEDFYGKYCQHQYLPCETRDNPCGHVDSRGFCIDMEGIDNYRCACNFLYTGEHCEMLSNDFCSDSPCNKTDRHAQCINAMSSHFCICSPGYYGLGCYFKVDYCKGVTCHFEGTCVDGEDGFTCICRPGYTGELCEGSIEGCDSNTCNATGTRWCQSEDSHNYTCICREGYQGDHCEAIIDYCTSLPCLNGATCLPMFLDYRCMCTSGYTGELCEDKFDVCQSRPCINNGACAANDEGSYNCTCSELYEGARCERRKRMCYDGYCDSAGTCYETLEGAICHCRHDYIGDRCETRVDDCVDNKCADGSTCIDSVLSYKCRCAAGRYGLLCDEQVDPCNNNDCIHGTCDSSGVEGGSVYVCRCYPGFTGNYCEGQLDECSSNPCSVGSTCYDAVNGYVCICSAGYYGSQCQHKVDYCVNNNCSDNSVCLSGNAGFTCNCHSGYTGRYCEEEINECLMMSCYHGNCTDLVDGYRCDCDAGWSGRQCSVRVGFCKKDTCGPNGACLEALTTYYCKCIQGYTGKHCERKQTGFCTTVWCGPNAYCKELGYGFVCLCQSSWTGPDCSVPVGCNPFPCSTRGKCMAVGESGVCNCQPNWTGRTCREPVDACQYSPCGKHGICHNLLDGDYLCQCKLGTKGPNCIDSIDNCARVKCANGGSCEDKVNNFQCHCPDGYAGKLCQLKLSDAKVKEEEYVSSIMDGSAEVNLNKMDVGLQANARSSECDFGRSSESLVYIISNLIGLLLLTIICIAISRAHLSKHRSRLTNGSAAWKNR